MRAGNLSIWMLLALLLCAVTPASLGADLLTGRVVGIQDGDTLDLLLAGTTDTVRVRLAGIDCPEAGQPFGRRARQALAAAVFRREVQIETRKTDRFGRIVGKMLLDHVDVNLALVREGWCWWYRQFAQEQSVVDRNLYESAEINARAARRGLWVDPAPIPPWDFRRQPEPPEGYAAACPCDSGRVCTGPRGGRFCVRPSGTRRYVPRANDAADM